jgi:hypothetical protein
VHDNIGLSGHINSCLFHQAKLPEIPVEILCAHPLTDIDKDRVAGIL